MASRYIEFKNISKHFPGVKALTDISFRANAGSVHALMGENGAGKSTLLKVLSGYHRPTNGTLNLHGEDITFEHAADALEHGIAVIYQELNLVPEMSVAENIFLGQFPVSGMVVDRKRLNELAQEQLTRLGIDVSPDTALKHLSIGQWQMVEIAKALSRNAEIIAFDEPTSSLSSREIKNLFKVIRELRDQGKIILYVSHRMEEIFDLCDAITIFKDGTHVQTFNDISVLKPRELVRLMVGRDIQDIYNYHPRPLGDVGLEVKSLLGPGLRKPVSLSVRKGEVVGIFGLVGAGRTELLKLIFAAEKRAGGEIQVLGQQTNLTSPRDAIDAGITLCPEDRKEEGIIPILSIKENTNVSARSKHARHGIVDEKWEHQNAEHQVNSLNVKTPSLAQAIMNLSGGNQQKAILGRWLSVDMKVLLLDEPTRGIDIGAKSEIYNLIFGLAEQGITVLFVSSDLPEVIGLADRIIVMREGEVAGEVPHDQAREEDILAMAMLKH